jgi:DNA-binding GntR family transcriptional regulator
MDIIWGQEWGQKSAARHRRILEALNNRDPDQVEQRLRETISLAEEELVQGLQEMGWGDERQNSG